MFMWLHRVKCDRGKHWVLIQRKWANILPVERVKDLQPWPAGNLSRIDPHRQLLGKAQILVPHRALLTGLLQHGVLQLHTVHTQTPEAHSHDVQLKAKLCFSNTWAILLSASQVLLKWTERGRLKEFHQQCSHWGLLLKSKDTFWCHCWMFSVSM